VATREGGWRWRPGRRWKRGNRWRRRRGGRRGWRCGAVSGKLGTLKFTRKDLNRLNLAEASTFGDYNKDGHVDVLSGPYWWEGPAFDKAHELDQPSCTPANPAACNCYTCTSEGDWATIRMTSNGDGWIDAVRISRPGNPSYCSRTPECLRWQTDAKWTRD